MFWIDTIIELVSTFAGPKLHPDSFVRHDQLGYIGHDRAFSAGGMNLPVPVGMFLPQQFPGPQPMPPSE